MLARWVYKCLLSRFFHFVLVIEVVSLFLTNQRGFFGQIEIVFFFFRYWMRTGVCLVQLTTIS